MLASLDSCQTYALGLEMEKKRKIKREVRIGPTWPFLFQASSGPCKPPNLPNLAGSVGRLGWQGAHNDGIAEFHVLAITTPPPNSFF